MIELGQRVRDTVSGFQGICINRTEWLNGCVRIGIQPEETRDGKALDSSVFDEEQVEVVDAATRHTDVRRRLAMTNTGEPSPLVASERTGGDRPDVQRRTDPAR